MILVLLGTQDKPFTRLLDAIQDCIDRGIIKEEVVVQAGHTKYESKDMEIFGLVPSEKYDELMKSANLIITHGGVSSIISGLKKNIPVIAAARLKEHGEHMNDHQLEIIDKFAEEGHILALNDFSELDKILEKSKKFKAKKYISTTNKVVELIENYIENKDRRD